MKNDDFFQIASYYAEPCYNNSASGTKSFKNIIISNAKTHHSFLIQTNRIHSFNTNKQNSLGGGSRWADGNRATLQGAVDAVASCNINADFLLDLSIEDAEITWNCP